MIKFKGVLLFIFSLILGTWMPGATCFAGDGSWLVEGSDIQQIRRCLGLEEKVK